jgi:hypothetical protein
VSTIAQGIKQHNKAVLHIATKMQSEDLEEIRASILSGRKAKKRKKSKKPSTLKVNDERNRVN